ncbi:glycoside hydrolase family 26 protein [Halomarina salina]|uniref:Glycoside hydrolase family 26 protein n=1 Tax=Halomarina salina TaxID=1872699 RepID=A0ABD5RHV9_9EURY|nr:glycosyl hydrolase [Halomarina salina]
MDRRTFLSLGGGVLGVLVGGAHLGDALSRPRDEDEGGNTTGPSTTPSATEATEATEQSTTEERQPTETPPRSFEPRDGDLLLGTSPQTLNVSALSALERWQGGQNAVVAVYVDVGASREDLLGFAESVLTSIWEHGNVPHVIWQPYVDGREGTPETIPQDIAAGDHDRLLDRWADVLERWLRPHDGPERRLYLNFAPEMNGDWVPWDDSAGGTTAADYAAMYRHVHDVVMARDLTERHVQWVWAVNHTGRTSSPLSAFYPGDDYVDWCGVHGYNWSNWGGWKSPERVYGRTLDELAGVSDKPVLVSEYGCSSEVESGHDPAKKGEWIRDVFAYFRERGVGMALWFNHEKETDWAVFGGSRGTERVTIDGTTYDAYREYREAVGADWVLPAYPDHPRRLTDAEFRGAFDEATVEVE